MQKLFESLNNPYFDEYWTQSLRINPQGLKSVYIDEAEAAENLELPGADLSGEELAVKVVPKQEDEFTCSRCFLVKHINQRAKGEGPKAVCRDCD